MIPLTYPLVSTLVNATLKSSDQRLSYYKIFSFLSTDTSTWHATRICPGFPHFKYMKLVSCLFTADSEDGFLQHAKLLWKGTVTNLFTETCTICRYSLRRRNIPQTYEQHILASLANHGL
jgi:hypothetical protein